LACILKEGRTSSDGQRSAQKTLSAICVNPTLCLDAAPYWICALADLVALALTIGSATVKAGNDVTVADGFCTIPIGVFSAVFVEPTITVLKDRVLARQNGRT
jgi:hypothetical protein